MCLATDEPASRTQKKDKRITYYYDYKYDEIKEHFDDFISDQDSQWIEDNIDDIHYHAFNTDYYIIGTYNAKQWLGDYAFDVIGTIKEYEIDNFGEVYTDLSDPEKVVNMYAYIIGEQVVYEWLQEREENDI